MNETTSSSNAITKLLTLSFWGTRRTLSDGKEASDAPSALSNFEFIYRLLFVEATQGV
jgi:hypothetical protein